MAKVIEDTKGKIRDLPITENLRGLLGAAANSAGVDTVRVTSGGQCRKGTCDKRTGSTRHDDGHAADLQLLVGGRRLDFTSAADRTVFTRFVTAAAKAGATGLGAGLDYMGAQTIHVGFGAKAVWGAGGKAEKAPDWLKKAALAGWGSGTRALTDNIEDFDSTDEEVETDYRDDGGDAVPQT